MEEFIQSERIRNIIKVCPKSKEVFEIGCDHGYITMGLLLSGKTKSVIATDISENAINTAIINCQKRKLLPFISFRQGDGFSIYTKYDKAPTAVIAGLGGTEMVKILNDKPSHVKDLVLNPMTDDYMVREWLISNKFKIVRDFMVKSDGFFYTIIYATKAKEKENIELEPIYMYFGKENFDNVNNGDDEFIEYLKTEEAKIVKLFNKIGEISNGLNFKYQIVTEALNMCGIELLPVGDNTENTNVTEEDNTVVTENAGNSEE